MVILVDTNIILDIYLNRGFDESLKSIEKATKHHDKLFFSSSSFTDFYYIACSETHSKALARKYAIDLAKRIHFADVTGICIYKSLVSEINDLEDALIDTVAFNVKADYILTRNKKDFEQSKVKAITPKEFLSL